MTASVGGGEASVPAGAPVGNWASVSGATGLPAGRSAVAQTGGAGRDGGRGAQARGQDVARPALARETCDVVGFVLDLVREQLDAPVAMLTVLDGTGEPVVAVIEGALVGARPGVRAPLLCRRCLDTGGRLVVTDAACLADLALARRMAAAGMNAYLGITLYAGGRPVGIVSAADTAARQWTQRDVSVLEGYAAVVEVELRGAMVRRAAHDVPPVAASRTQEVCGDPATAS